MTDDIDGLTSRLELLNPTDLDDQFGELVDIVNKLNHLDLVSSDGRIAKVVGKLREVTQKVAAATGAIGYSISVGLPAGITVTIDWPTTAR